ncbi:MAG: phosphoenolpyruvate carboxykinase, partial [Deltaproteobacteria bacterium]|nr:phosphoenolpyruvate carboxykinase [Deltaproteobacteria bacterium]
MNQKYVDLLKSKMSDASYGKLMALENERLVDFVGEYIELCEPASVYFADDSKEDADYIRAKSIELGEETKLSREGQTIHYDGYGDQGRDKANTKFMVSQEKMEAMKNLNTVLNAEGLAEIKRVA